MTHHFVSIAAEHMALTQFIFLVAMTTGVGEAVFLVAVCGSTSDEHDVVELVRYNH